MDSVMDSKGDCKTRRVAILGCTGSVGRSALEVVAAFPERLRVEVLACGRRIDDLLEQLRQVRVSLVAVAERSDAERVRREVPAGTRVTWGPGGLIEAATHPDTDIVLAGIVGAAGLPSTFAALSAGKPVALANKEALVVAGDIMMAESRRRGAAILPVDSEHNAIHQALRTGAPGEVAKLWLTASGGPFRSYPLEKFEAITIAEALAHPVWRMGPKISIDSATMMNKGLEIIEAHYLFGSAAAQIGVVVHPQGVVHSLVEFRDGSVVAELAVSDMKLPIQYALSYPERWGATVARLDLLEIAALEFLPVEARRYPAVGLAIAALAAGGSAPAVLNAANEVMVARFLAGGLRFPDIVRGVEQVLGGHSPKAIGSLDDALGWDAWARERAAVIEF